MGLGIKVQARGEIGGVAQRQGRKIGRSRKRRFEQIASFRGLGEERRDRGKLGGVIERLGDAFENVGSPARVIDAWGFGDTRDERRYAALVSDPACS